MKFKKLSVEQAIDRAKTLPWALIYTYSRVILGEYSEVSNLNLDELLYARFFAEHEEVRLFRTEYGIQGSYLIEDPELDDCLEERYRLNNPQFGESIMIRHILKSDEDGQTYRAASHLAGWTEVQMK